MATDMVTSPVTPTGQPDFRHRLRFHRLYPQVYPLPEGVTFAILVMNALVPLLDRLTVPLWLGVGVPREQRFQGTVAGIAIAMAAFFLVFAIVGPEREASACN